MLGNIYSNYLERIKVISKTKGGYKCIKWLNGESEEVKLSKSQLKAMQFICTIN